MRSLFFTGIVLAGFSIVSAQAADTTVFEIGSSDQIPTVKVISYTLTKDNDLIPSGAGSATIITADGYLVTNYHVAGDLSTSEEKINDIFEICYTFKTDVQIPKCLSTASYVGGNKDDDIAVLKISSQDIYGNTIPNFNFLSYKGAIKPTVGDLVTTIGYPDIGGTSITYTSGQVSGYLNTEGVELIKSDAKISNGNSGGTAVNSTGVFIGIPSAGRTGWSSGETLGYFLPIANYESWIEKNIQSTNVHVNISAENELKNVLKQFDAANKSKVYTMDNSNFRYTITASEGWKFFNALDDLFGDKGVAVELGKRSVSILPTKGFSYVTLSYVKEAFDRSVEDIKKFDELNRPYLSDYKGFSREIVTLNGKYPAVKVTYKDSDYFGDPNNTLNYEEYLIPHGTATIQLFTQSNSKSPEEQNKIKNMIASFTLDLEVKPNFTASIIRSDVPHVTVKNTSSVWHMVESHYLAKAPAFNVWLEHKTDLESHISMNYYEAYDNETDPELKEFYKAQLESAKSYSIVMASGNDLFIGGKKAYFILSRIELPPLPGSTASSVPHIFLDVYIPDGAHYYEIRFDAKSEKYNEYFPFIKKFLSSIEFDKPGRTELYQLTALENSSFIDTSNYKYESEISALKDEGIIKGFSDKTFRPTQEITRAEFLKILLESMDDDIEKTELNKYKASVANGHIFTASGNKLSDLEENSWYLPYVLYAVDKGIIQGYPDNTFKPHASIRLAEALKMLMKTQKIDVWKTENLPYHVDWFIPYMDKATSLQILPYGVSLAAEPITRGDMAYVVYHTTHPNNY
ncbi:MAG: S-layer homology domain-containing protein [Candidatus Gracilibacteria bacterium]